MWPAIRYLVDLLTRMYELRVCPTDVANAARNAESNHLCMLAHSSARGSVRVSQTCPRPTLRSTHLGCGTVCRDVRSHIGSLRRSARRDSQEQQQQRKEI